MARRHKEASTNSSLFDWWIAARQETL